MKQNLPMEQKVEELYKKLLKLHPECQEEINVLKRAYDYPFEHFCNREAEYRLNNDFDIDESIKDYKEIKDLIAHDLMDADNYPDPEVADDIIKDMLNEHAFRMTKATSKEMESTSLINIEKSDPDVLTRKIMKDIGLNTLDAYDSIFESLSSGEFPDYIVYCHLLEGISSKFDKDQDELNDWHEVKDLSNHTFTEKLWIRHLEDCKCQALCIRHELAHDYKVIAKLITKDEEKCFHIASFHKIEEAIRKSKQFMEIL